MTVLHWLLVLLLTAASAGAQPLAAPHDYPLNEVQRGQLGYGLTAGPQGIERFDVEVLGLHDGFGLGFPLILVQTRGAIIDAAGGVAAGMSGSPVYLSRNDRPALLGAIAYVFPDATGGVALLTPIAAMRSAAGEPEPAPIVRQPAARKLLHVSSPLLVNGLGQRSLTLLLEELGAITPFPWQAQSGGGASEVAVAPLEAGSPVGVAWLRGDIDIAAVGTVTEVRGEEVLAFGHRLLGIGAVAWPLIPAEVVALIPNRSVPFKLANVGRGVIGSVTQDRSAAVVARLDARPTMLPVDLTIVTAERRVTLRFEAVRDPVLWPVLVAAASLEGIERTRGKVGPGSASIDWEISLAGAAPLRLSEQVVASGEVNLPAARLIGAPLQLLASNPFQNPQVERVSLLVRLDDLRRDSEVLKVIDDGAPAVAGEMVRLFVSLQPWRRAGVVIPVDVRWPEALDGRVEIVARGASTPPRAGEEAPRSADDNPLTFDELLVFLRERPAGGDLVIEARRPGERWQRLARVPIQGFAHGRAEWTLEVAARPEGEEEEDR